MFGFGIGIQEDQRSQMIPKIEKREKTSFKVLDVLSRTRRLMLLLREGPTLIFEMF
jgi:hypothetical protein